MGKHYLPQFYLRGFCTGNAIQAYDRSEGRHFGSQPKSVGNETAMYPQKVEDYLAQQIEDPAKPAIESIREHKPISEPERRALANYIIAMWKRVPEARQRNINQAPDLAASARKRAHQKIDVALAVNPELNSQAEKLRAEVDRLIALYVQDPSPEPWLRTIPTASTPRVIDGLLAMQWTFLVSENLQFLTCDNPVFFFEHLGIARRTSELTIPFSSTVALWANWRPRPLPLYRMAKPATVKELNRRAAHNATRYLYAARAEEWIVPFMMKGHYKLHRLL